MEEEAQSRGSGRAASAFGLAGGGGAGDGLSTAPSGTWRERSGQAACVISNAIFLPLPPEKAHPAALKAGASPATRGLGTGPWRPPRSPGTPRPSKEDACKEGRQRNEGCQGKEACDVTARLRFHFFPHRDAGETKSQAELNVSQVFTAQSGTAYGIGNVWAGRSF